MDLRKHSALQDVSNAPITRGRFGQRDSYLEEETLSLSGMSEIRSLAQSGADYGKALFDLDVNELMTRPNLPWEPLLNFWVCRWCGKRNELSTESCSCSFKAVVGNDLWQRLERPKVERHEGVGVRFLVLLFDRFAFLHRVTPWALLYWIDRRSGVCWVGMVMWKMGYSEWNWWPDSDCLKREGCLCGKFPERAAGRASV